MLLVGVLAVSSADQSLSQIGAHLSPWSNASISPISMTPDGLIAFVDGIGPGCEVLERISVIRADGTDYRVIVDWEELFALRPNGHTEIRSMRISGDGQTIWFRWPDQVFECAGLPPSHSYLVDVASGSVSEFTFNGTNVGSISFSDDGSRMAFAGVDSRQQTVGYYIANPDGSGARRFLDNAPWYTVIGVLSGDASKFLFIGFHGPFPFPTDVYIYDFETDGILKLSRETLDGIKGASLSADGSRVVYHQAGDGPVYAVHGDGTGFRVLYEGTGIGIGGTGTLTRDGESVFFSDTDTDTMWRIGWDGTGLELVAQNDYNTVSFIAPQPVNRDGSIAALWLWNPANFLPTLTVSYLSPPMLTTYGYGNPGTTLTWDVGGQPGDTCYLLFGVAPTGLLQPHHQAFGLPPNVLPPVLAAISGPMTVLAPNNIGSRSLTLPRDLSLPQPLSMTFWALVDDHSGAPLQITNSTTVTFSEAPSSLTQATAPPPRNSRWPGGQVRRRLDGRGLGELSPEEQMRRLALQDPAVAARGGDW